MKHIVIGTAGHVDHGKTLLTKALTGVDTDRLPEEKKRGLTIEAGFAPLFFNEELSADVIDVPGHERFIKNMLSGVAGIDLALIVIAANEGMMPQTREHLRILELLGIQRGVIALTKIDLVDEEQLFAVEEQVRQFLVDTPFRQSALVAVSAVNYVGVDVLKRALAAEAAAVSGRSSQGLARLPVDRVFVKPGFGVVVTGTLFSGAIVVGGELQIWPSGKRVRIRGLQIHGQSVKQAQAGQRVAVNLAALTRDEIERGCWLAEADLLRQSIQPLVQITLLPEAKALAQRSRVRIHHGATEVLGRVILLQQDSLQPGHSAAGQLLLEQPIYPLVGDRLILRSYSPAETVGGGELTEIDPPKLNKKRRRMQFVNGRNQKSGGIIASLAQGTCFRSSIVLAQELQLPLAQIQSQLDLLFLMDQVVMLDLGGEAYYGLRQRERELVTAVIESCLVYQQKYPLREGISQAELLSGLKERLGSRLFAVLLHLWRDEGQILYHDGKVTSQDFCPVPTDGQMALLEQLMAAVEQGGCMPPTWEELCAKFKINFEQSKELLLWLMNKNKLTRLPGGLVVATAVVQQALHCLYTQLRRKEFSLAEARDILGISRKYALPLLEYADQQKITLRQGDKRYFIQEVSGEK